MRDSTCIQSLGVWWCMCVCLGVFTVGTHTHAILTLLRNLLYRHLHKYSEFPTGQRMIRLELPGSVE